MIGFDKAPKALAIARERLLPPAEMEDNWPVVELINASFARVAEFAGEDVELGTDAFGDFVVQFAVADFELAVGLLLLLQPLLARERRVMRGDCIVRKALVQLVREPLGGAARVGEHERGAVGRDACGHGRRRGVPRRRCGPP